MSLALQNALETLYGLERRRDRLGLDGTIRLLEALGDPQRRFRAVHVGGTNGKGSTSALIERVLRASGLSTGLFTSPHLVDFRERIRVDGRWADEARLERRLAHLQSLPEGQDCTFFEAATALAFDHFAAARAAWAVVEVGLGGRLDCTNVVTPEVAAITHVGLDHTEILGGTIERVAFEKAGIAKPEVPLVSGVLEPRASAVIEARAREAGAPLVRAHERVRVRGFDLSPGGLALDAEVAPWGRIRVMAALRGAHQRDNLVVALAVLSVLAERVEIPRAALEAGFAAARWPGRLEPCPTWPRLWWDGAHNPDGIARLVGAWREDLGFEPPRTLVIALSGDKDPDAMLAPLADLAPAATLIATQAKNPRALAAEVLAGHARRWRFAVEVAPDVATAARRALERAGLGRALLVGSLFAVGEAMEAFGAAPSEWQ